MAVELLPKLLPKLESRTGFTLTDLTGGDIKSVTQALGRDSNIAALYDVRFGITTAAGTVSQWDDARGTVGFGPSLAQATAGKQPAWDANALTMTFDGVDDDLFTPASALFDLSGGKTVIMVGAIPTSAATKYAFGIFDASVLTRGLSAYVNTATSRIVGSLTAAGATSDASSASTLASATRRVVAVSKPADGTLSALDMPAIGRVTLAHVGNAASASNTLVVGSRWDTVAGQPAVVRAIIVLNSQISPTQVNSLLNWAVMYHGITPA